jgi:hypothetical protein
MRFLEEEKLIFTMMGLRFSRQNVRWLEGFKSLKIRGLTHVLSPISIKKFKTGVQYQLLGVTAVGYWPPLQSAVKHCNYTISLYVGSLLL